MTVRTKLLVAIGALAVCACYLSTSTLLKDRRRKAELELARRNAAVIDDLLQAAGSWAVERGVTFSALNADTPATPKTFAKIRTFRKKGNAAFEAAMQKLEDLDFDGKNKMISDLARAVQSMNTVRGLAEKNLQVSKAGRDSTLLPRWLPTACDLIEQSQELRFVLTGRTAQIDPELGRQAQLRHFSWLMSEFSGRERAVLGGAIAAGKKLNSEQLSKLGLFRGRFDIGRDIVMRLQANSVSEVRAAVEQSESMISGEFGRVRSSVIQAGRDGKPFPVTTDKWIATATKSINTILAVQKASTAESDAYIESRINTIDASNRNSLILVTLTLLVAGLTIAFTLRGVTIPLTRLTSLTGMLAGENTDIAIPYTERTDEIGGLAQGLACFKNALIERLRLEEEERVTTAQRAREAEEEAATKVELAEKERARAHRIDGLLASFAQRIGEFTSGMDALTSRLQGNSGTLAALAEETGSEAEILTRKTESMDTLIADIRGATDEMRTTVGNVESSVDRTETMIERVSGFSGKVDGLTGNFNSASAKVTGAVELISSIASQINLLSLNAGIEAARAGEAGKGFAVVASQVKSLAGNTRTSVDEIEHVVGDMNSVSMTMADALRDVGTSMDSVLQAASEISQSIEVQKSEADNIVQAIRTSAGISTDVSDTSRQLAAGATRATSISMDVNAISDDLVDRSRELTGFIDQFLQEVRSA